MLNKRKIFGAITGVAMLFSAALFATAPAANASAADTGTDPANGCYIGSYEYTSHGLVDQYAGGVNVGTEQLMWSPNCGTNWVNIYGYANGYHYVGYIRSQGYQYGTTAWNANSAEHTLQIYAPGATCVNMDYYVFRNSDNLDVNSGTNQYC